MLRQLAPGTEGGWARSRRLSLTLALERASTLQFGDAFAGLCDVLRRSEGSGRGHLRSVFPVYREARGALLVLRVSVAVELRTKITNVGIDLLGVVESSLPR